MRKTYEYRLRPTKAQENRLVATLTACRFIYNWGIEDRKVLWQYCHVSANFNDQSCYLKHLKDANPWLKEVHAHPLQDAIRRVERSFDRFFKAAQHGHGYPRFKGRNQYDSFTFKEWGNGASFNGKRLYLSKIGRVRIVLHRPIEGDIKICTVKRRADGWYALFSVVCEDPEPSTIRDPVGIDLGLESFATLSTGEKIENPRYLRTNEQELKIAHRKVSRREKGSHRRRKAVQHLRQVHLRVQRSRKSFHFTEAYRLARRFNPIIVEHMNIKGMLRNHCLAGSITDASWGRFLGILSRSAESAGGASIAVEARGTSQECAQCGRAVPKTLLERWHVCPCGYIVPRDENSARVILKRGLGRSVGEGACSKTLPMIREAAPLERQRSVT
jgi:putative transposase